MNAQHEELIREYFQAIENGVPVARFESFFHPNIIQHEFPSRLNPNGKTRRKPELLADFERGQSVIARQIYTLKSMVSDGDRVCVETEWKGVLAVPLGSLKAGDAMQADFAVFFRIAEGRILEQRNYDCLHPW